MRKPLAFLLLAFLVPACSVKASFVASDASYQAVRGGREPAVYLSEAPSAPYRVVGTVALYGVDDDEPEDGLEAAVAKGRAYGCDVLVERSVHERAVNGDRAVVASADASYVGMAGPGPSVNVDLEEPSVNVDLGDGPSRRGGRRELVCGVWQSEAPTPDESAVPDASEPPAPVDPNPSAAEPVPVEI